MVKSCPPGPPDCPVDHLVGPPGPVDHLVGPTGPVDHLLCENFPLGRKSSLESFQAKTFTKKFPWPQLCENAARVHKYEIGRGKKSPLKFLEFKLLEYSQLNLLHPLHSPITLQNHHHHPQSQELALPSSSSSSSSKTPSPSSSTSS